MEFWPATLKDVLGVIIQVLSISTIVGGAVWGLLKGRIEKGDSAVMAALESEERDRKLADERVEEKLVKNNDEVHVVMGKIELLDTRIQNQERALLQQGYELRDTLKDGLHHIELELAELRKERRDR